MTEGARRFAMTMTARRPTPPKCFGMFQFLVQMFNSQQEDRLKDKLDPLDVDRFVFSEEFRDQLPWECLTFNPPNWNGIPIAFHSVLSKYEARVYGKEGDADQAPYVQVQMSTDMAGCVVAVKLGRWGKGIVGCLTLEDIKQALHVTRDEEVLPAIRLLRNSHHLVSAVRKLVGPEEVQCA